MPGWIWVILVIAFFAVLIGGGAYVFVHARNAVRSVKPLGEKAETALARMHDEDAADKPHAKDPAFTRPLSDVADDYSRAHARLLRNKEKAKLQHIDSWSRWSQFNE